MVNDAFVKKFIPAGLDPTAQRMDDHDKQEDWTRIVGVTGNVRQNIYEPPMAERDWLMEEVPLKEQTDNLSGMTLLVRTSGDPKAVIPALRAIIHSLDPTVPFEEPRTMSEIVSETLIFERTESWLFGIFAGLALVLALVGLHGLVSNEVEQGEARHRRAHGRWRIAPAHSRDGASPRGVDAWPGRTGRPGADNARAPCSGNGDLL